MSDNARDGAFDDWLDAVEDGEGYYVECENGHGWLPPRRVCPDCGSRDLTETPLAEAGEVATYTEVSVATPQFSADTPYVTAIVDYGPVRVTGLLRGVDPDEVEVGMPVGIEAGERETTGDRAVVFRPR
ncbi:OB-fold domain-containing protein [Halosimplex litoreum]|uniref:OB-fold domain-containing protein n=1 Tax=Halosimplex litoreum TaxID=1198301 RepID=A0A7T3G100_9EURY|nr:OB-fold domain-containing protein [Halosimplex litoreum]QPV63938.1 OB-fold domain-containing protein [Halosimplex litoreum]